MSQAMRVKERMKVRKKITPVKIKVKMNLIQIKINFNTKNKKNKNSKIQKKFKNNYLVKVK